MIFALNGFQVVKKPSRGEETVARIRAELDSPTIRDFCWCLRWNSVPLDKRPVRRVRILNKPITVVAPKKVGMELGDRGAIDFDVVTRGSANTDHV